MMPLASPPSSTERRRPFPEGLAAKCFWVAQGRTQASVARELDVDQGTLSKLLSGRLDTSEAYRMELWRKLWLLLSDPEARS